MLPDTFPSLTKKMLLTTRILNKKWDFMPGPKKVYWQKGEEGLNYFNQNDVLSDLGKA